MACDGDDRARHLVGRGGFWIFLASKGLWAAWGLHDRAYARVGLRFFLATENVRGVLKNERTT